MKANKATDKQINAVVLIDKPIGMSSNALLQKVKRLYGVKKAGHTGSLDPLASGMLPICLGEATKFSQYLLEADKCYQTTGLLGIKTSTSDAEGEVLAQCQNPQVSSRELEAVLAQFRGEIKQCPSPYSALKYQGKPYYEYARAGLEIPRKHRDIVIKALSLEHLELPFFTLRVLCSKGTYIRNLVEDIGEGLKVGAHVSMLRRLYTQGYEEAQMITLQALEEMTEPERFSRLRPMDEMVAQFTALRLTPLQLLLIQQGRVLEEKALESSAGQFYRLYDHQGQFIGLGEGLLHNRLKAKRLLSSQ